MKNKEPLTVNLVRTAHLESLDKIQARLAEFAAIWYEGSDANIWEEMVFCIFTANASARMGMRSVAAVRDLLHLEKTEAADLARVLTGIHRFPNARSGYIITTRDFLQEDCRMRLRKRLENFSDAIERRDWLVREKRIKGLGYKEASHFLRNIGLRGYAILDKHILNSLAELGVIDEAKPPANRQRYLAIEEKMRDFSHRIAIDFDELDLVLWSMKTGEILK